MENYETNIQIEDGLKIEEESEENSPTKIRSSIEKEDFAPGDEMRKSFNLAGKKKEGSKKKIDWLETTLVAEKMK